MSRNSAEYIIGIEFPKLFEAIKKFLKPQDAGFELVYYGEVPGSFPSIFYQSKQCQIRIQCLRDRPWDEIETHTSYGRLHAPLDKDIIEWKNEECYCWHSLSSPLISLSKGA